MPMRLTVELSQELTWEELITFVDAARLHVQSRQKVEILNRENEADWIPERLAVELPSGSRTGRSSMTTRHVASAPFCKR